MGDYRVEATSWGPERVARPAETIFLCDHPVFDWGMAVQKLYYPAPRHLRQPDVRLADGSTVLQGVINAAFVDGHVRALTHVQLWVTLRGYSQRGGPSRDVFQHFWPYE